MPAVMPIIASIWSVLLLSTPTLAQQPPPGPPGEQAGPQQKAPEPASAPMSPPAPDQTTAPAERQQTDSAAAPPRTAEPGAPPRTPEEVFLPKRILGQWMATGFIGSTVYGQNQEAIAEVKDLVIDKSGKIAAAILSVGGFLGMGEKWVAVHYDAIQLTVRDGRAYLTMALTRADLDRAPSYGAP
jgi:hypothetical protein